MIRRVFQHWRCRRSVAWLQSNAPEVYRRITRKEVPLPIQQHLLRHLASEPYRQLSKPNGRNHSLHTHLLYIAGGVTPDMIKDVIALRHCRSNLHCTLMAFGLGHVSELAQRYFDRIVLCQNHIDMIRRLLEFRADVCIVHHRGLTGSWTPLIRLFWDGRLIFRAYPLHARSPRGVMIQQKLDNDINFVGEQYLLEHVDGIYHPYSDKAIDALRQEMNIRCSALTVRSECMLELGPFEHLKRLSEKDGEIHLVYAAGLSRRRNGQLLGPSHSDHFEKWQTIVGQKLHLHVYVPQIITHQNKDGFEDYFRLAARSPYFHIETPLSYDRLLVELTKYDWAFHHFDFDRYPLRAEFAYGGSNGFYTHIQAGNLLLCSPSQPLYAEIVKRYGIGLVIQTDQWGQLRECLEKFDRRPLEGNLKKAQKELTFDDKALFHLVFGQSEHDPSCR